VVALIGKAEELRGAHGVELAIMVCKDGKDGRVLAYRHNLLARENCGEAMEHGGLGLGIHVEDEGLGSFITGNNGKQNEEENNGRKGIQYLFTHFKDTITSE